MPPSAMEIGLITLVSILSTSLVTGFVMLVRSKADKSSVVAIEKHANERMDAMEVHHKEWIDQARQDIKEHRESDERVASELRGAMIGLRTEIRSELRGFRGDNGR